MRATWTAATAFASLALALAPAGPAAAQTPIPEGPDAAALPSFEGEAAVAKPVWSAPDPPRHPFMAPNGRSNIHVDGYQTDVHQVPGPLGRGTERSSNFFVADCASVTFDAQGRIITVCVGIDRPTLRLLDPVTLAVLAEQPLPPRRLGAGSGSIFNDFAGGGYFYLDHEGRAVIPTTDHRIVTYRVTDAPAFELVDDVDVSGALADDDKIISALPDWSGRIWFASIRGVVGILGDGGVRTADLGEPITNSFAVGPDGVYIVSDGALYRMTAGADGRPSVTWRAEYPNSGIAKPGQVGPGSGTTPTLMAEDLVAITDNADPMNVIVYRRADGSELCRAPVFEKGASATDNSLVATRDALIVENNYGYTGPMATQNGNSTVAGLSRVDVDREERRCTVRWTSGETAPTVVPKLSAANGLVYTYTKTPDSSGADAWYLTALDFRTGETVYKALSGEGLGHNNNYAPVTLGPDGTAYVGVLGGLVRLADAEPPVVEAARLRVKRIGRRGVRARVRGFGIERVVFRARGTRKVVTGAPYRVRLRAKRRQVRARVVYGSGERELLRARR